MTRAGGRASRGTQAQAKVCGVVECVGWCGSSAKNGAVRSEKRSEDDGPGEQRRTDQIRIHFWTRSTEQQRPAKDRYNTPTKRDTAAWGNTSTCMTNVEMEIDLRLGIVLRASRFR